MASQEPPLDEMQWHSQQMAINMLGIHSNSVLFYFAESPFFDKTSNNAVLYSQALYNQAMLPVIQTREAFEGRLKTMSGLEFMVAQEPADPVNGTGVWVIRKQTRRKKQNEEDEIVLHSTYFVMGENIYMAPAVADVLASRTVCPLSSPLSLVPILTQRSSQSSPPSTNSSPQLPPSHLSLQLWEQLISHRPQHPASNPPNRKAPSARPAKKTRPSPTPLHPKKHHCPQRITLHSSLPACWKRA